MAHMRSLQTDRLSRRGFVGGSDARIIMGTDEAALIRLWREKRGEAEPPDYSDNLLVQLGLTTEPLNRRWFEKTTGQAITPDLDLPSSTPLDCRHGRRHRGGHRRGPR